MLKQVKLAKKSIFLILLFVIFLCVLILTLSTKFAISDAAVIRYL